MKIPLFGARSQACLAVSSLAEQPPKTGKLIVAGGGVYSARKEIWTALLDAGIPNKPIGIIATAGSDSKQLAINTTDWTNKDFGEEAAIAIPLGSDPGEAKDPRTLELIRGCGGFFFTGGLQVLTTRALLEKDGSQTTPSRPSGKSIAEAAPARARPSSAIRASTSISSEPRKQS